MAGAIYNPQTNELRVGEETYNVYTGDEIDYRLVTIAGFAQGEVSLQQVYIDLLKHDLHLSQTVGGNVNSYNEYSEENLADLCRQIFNDESNVRAGIKHLRIPRRIVQSIQLDSKLLPELSDHIQRHCTEVEYEMFYRQLEDMELIKGSY